MKKRRRVLALLLAATLTFNGMPAVLANEGTKPQNSTTKEQPFWSGTGGSEKFRIPCLVSLNDGTLVAGCDARWTTHMDGGGLDTIVSYSEDNGATWNYTFANYLGDNGNVHNQNSTAFIDPAMATDGEKVYMIADLYPAGYALNGAKAKPVGNKSHDEKGNILLASKEGWSDVWCAERTKQENYTYRLVKNEGKKGEGAYSIQDDKGNVVEDYTVDEYFNVKGKGVDANLFEADSPYQVWPTDYLYMTTSEDGGKTWSSPSILNLRKDNEQSLLVGPGRGMVTSEGRIVFTAYEYTNGDKNSVAIYSDDEGKTWTRGQSVSGTSSEAVVTEADGKLYMFTRHGGYYVSNDWGQTWSAQQNMGISYNLGCQLTAITYPEKIDGKTAILFAAPSNTGSRAAGKIFVALVQDDGSLKWAYEYSINGSAYYAYSCLTVLPDGTVGLLYENGATEIKYVNLDIEDIVKGGAIGNIWCTDDAGKFVSEVTMKSNETKTFTVNGLKENAKVTVESDNEKAVTGTVENGKLKLTSQKVKGLEQAVVTVKAGEDSTKIRVNVTDSEKYEIVNLRVGDKKTYTDKTGNYSDSQLEGLDKTIAEVTLEGEDPKEVETVVKAKLATANGKFDGQEKELDSCLFTFTSVSGQANTYKISSKAGNTTVYLSHKVSTGKCPCSTTSSNILLEQQGDGKFALKDTSSGSAGQYLYFYKGDKTKLHFDRQNNVDDNCKFELYKKAEGEKSEIPGYKKVNQLSEVKNGEQYIIAIKGTDGAYYVLNPASTTNTFDHVAKVTTKEVEIKPEAEIQLGTDAKFNGEKKRISSSLFTFTKKNDKYVISGTTAKGETVYLTPKTATSGNTPLTKTSADIKVTKNNDGTFSFQQEAAGGAGGYLYFYKDTAKLYFDRNGEMHDNCKFDIYKASKDAKDSEITGYVKVKELSELTNNGQYLIASKGTDNKNYLLNPSAETDKYSYVAKVTGEMYKGQTTEAKTDITIKGVSEGKTEVTIGGTTYYIIVKNDVKEINLKVGETVNLAGKVIKTEGDAESITREEKNDMPPYNAITKLEAGTYLFGNDTHIMLNTPASAGNPSGLGMKAANFNTGDYKDSLWTLEKAGNGYTMKDVNGKYVNIDNQNVTLKDTPQTLTVTAKNNGGFAVSKDGYYLNNWAVKNDKVAAYAQDDNAWNFYKASVGNAVTGKNPGTVTLVTEGVTYKITVTQDSSTCEHTWGDWTVTTEATCTEAGEETRTCSRCHTTETRQTEALGHEFGEWEVTKEATCTEMGEETRTCSRCHATETRQTEALGHEFGEWEVTKEATCTEAGEETRTCSICHTTETRQTEALGHKFGEWVVVKEPTATEDGCEERVCERCGVKETRVLPATGEGNNNNNNGSGNNGNNNGGSAGNGNNQNNNGNAGNGSSQNNNGNAGNNGNQNQKPVKTGDASDPLTTAVGMAGCLGVIIAILRRKSDK
ncbi:MAG: sialidase family protein [Bacillota bacterium]|nr:sialidase family protein [Bacillota bacterium]MDU3180239.1 sialidase family protein [Lachnospiraceae bacterium]